MTERAGLLIPKAHSLRLVVFSGPICYHAFSASVGIFSFTHFFFISCHVVGVKCQLHSKGEFALFLTRQKQLTKFGK